MFRVLKIFSVAGGTIMAYCKECGQKLKDGAKFCHGCGVLVGVRVEEENHRKQVYEGEIHKCPNCGETLKSFVSMCPSCEYEIRGSKSTNSVREFAIKLEKIEAQKMPDFQEKKSVVKMVFGRDFGDKDEIEEARMNFKKQKEQEKINFIINYSVPNTKEDILEFLILASSNIDVKIGIDVDDNVSKAWKTKFEQVYQKAEISMSGESNFAQIKDIYEKKKKQIKEKRVKGILIVVGLVALWFFLIGLLWNPTATITIAVGVLLIIGAILYKTKK